MPRWIFIRHGESTANAAGKFSGWQDVALTKKGEVQALDAGRQLLGQDITQVLSSDLQRAHMTAQLAMAVWQPHNRPVEIAQLAQLRERCLGTFEGKSRKALQRSGEHRCLLGWDTSPPKGESLRDIALRAIPKLTEIECNGTTIVFSHGGTIRALLGLLDGTPKSEIATHHIPNGVPMIRDIPIGTWSQLFEKI